MRPYPAEHSNTGKKIVLTCSGKASSARCGIAARLLRVYDLGGATQDSAGSCQPVPVFALRSNSVLINSIFLTAHRFPHCEPGSGNFAMRTAEQRVLPMAWALILAALAIFVGTIGAVETSVSLARVDRLHLHAFHARFFGVCKISVF
jgi:hypothetical protein